MVNLPNIMIIGLTGQSGAGKSTVCEVFRGRGYNVVDCDHIARETARNTAFLEEISKRLSGDLLNPDGSLDRVKTARLIYSDNVQRDRYQRIIFPYIVFDVLEKIKSSDTDVLLDAPTLFEAKLDIVCTKIVSVCADKEICINRIIQRDGITEDRARERLDSQHSADFFKRHSDHYIENNATIEELIGSAADVTDKLKGIK